MQAAPLLDFPADLKTADSQGSQSSNLCASATFEAPFLRGFLLSEGPDFKGRWAGRKEGVPKISRNRFSALSWMEASP